MVARWWAAGVALAVGLLGGCSGDDGHGPSPGDDAALSTADISRIHDAVAASLGRGNATAYSVALFRDGRVIYAEAFGEKDSRGTPATSDTLFQIGSDTKKITALALLQKVERGELELSQSVAELFPALELASDRAFLETVTVRDLLRQTTGLFDYAGFFEAPSDDDLEAIALGRFADNEYALMPAGVGFNYSNPNYALAGLLIEALDSRPFADVLRDDVFAPLGLSHTYARRDDALTHEVDLASARGTSEPLDTFDLLELIALPEPKIEWVTPEDEIDNAFTRPAGFVWSTPSDQAKLLGFLIDGNPDVLSDELRRAMMSEQVSVYNHSEGFGYGYGLSVQRFYQGSDDGFYEVPFVAHDGGTLTMTLLSFMLPEQRVAVNVLANGVGEDILHVTQVTLEVGAGDRLPAPVGEPDLLGEPDEDLESYTGSFTDPNLGDVSIELVGQRLTVNIPALEPLGAGSGTLVPAGKDLFALKLAGAVLPVSFYDGPDGPHEYGVDRLFVLTRR